MIRRISLMILLLVALNSLEVSFFNNNAYAAKQGQSCTKVGLKSGAYLCTKVKGKLIWQLSKKQQNISISYPVKVSLTSQSIFIDYSASSRLPVSAISSTPEICALEGRALSLVTVGYCTIRFNQLGNAQFLGAKIKEIEILIQGSNEISFNLPPSLSLSVQTYPLLGSSTSALPLTYRSLTSDICTVSETTLFLIKVGLCSIEATQSGSDFYEAAKPVTTSITISVARVTSDQPDAVIGFQIKAIYVVPFDGIDHNYDTNGYIAGILDEGNEYLRSQLGLKVPIDKNTAGYDIQFFKSNLSTSYFLTASDLTEKLLVESQGLENPGLNRKGYIFFIDVNNLMDGIACGYAQPILAISAVVAIGQGAVKGSTCTGKAFNFNDYASSAWPHELFHNFGVKHTLDSPCDLMRGGPETTGTCTSPGATLTVDKERSRYVSSSAQGQDILKLRVWEGYTDRKDLVANCSLNPAPRADGVNYAYCPTGTQTIGALKYCYSSISSVALEEFVDGAWKNLGPGNHFSDPWGPAVAWKCRAGSTAPWKQLTITTPGISLYRWMINGSESEQFKVIWVR